MAGVELGNALLERAALLGVEPRRGDGVGSRQDDEAFASGVVMGSKVTAVARARSAASWVLR